jgi:hypothetical protein
VQVVSVPFLISSHVCSDSAAADSQDICTGCIISNKSYNSP